MGIPEPARVDILRELKSPDARAANVEGRYNADGRGRIFLNGSAFPAGLLSVLAHEFIHLAGERGVTPPWYKKYLGHDDLSFDDKYQEVIDICAKAGKPFAE